MAGGAAASRVCVIGTPVTPQRFAAAVDTLTRMTAAREGGSVSAANAYGATLALRDPLYLSLLRSASMVTADGMPIVWMLRTLGHDAERVHNDDLLLTWCARNPGGRVALVGGRDGQPEAVAAALGARCPDVAVVGCFATPQRPVPRERTEAIIAGLESAAPDIVWVGMGTPAQDVWMASVRGRIGSPMVGCGSLFDLLTGRTKPTPDWMKRAGLQWLFRLCQEPRRLFARYLVFNALFVVAAARQLGARKLGRPR
jgi:N-acetylglucosaminyldiphosphoundecaprenol N-acetyl-beta-D-mannosaminyltransferase